MKKSWGTRNFCLKAEGKKHVKGVMKLATEEAWNLKRIFSSNRLPLWLIRNFAGELRTPKKPVECPTLRNSLIRFYLQLNYWGGGSSAGHTKPTFTHPNALQLHSIPKSTNFPRYESFNLKAFLIPAINPKSAFCSSVFHIRFSPYSPLSLSRAPSW